MDEYSGKRAVSGFSVSGRGSGLALRDESNHDDRSVQYCNRLVCSNRPNSMRSTKVSSSDRDKLSNSFRSTSGKTIVGTTSKMYSPLTNHRKPHHGQQKCKEAVSAEVNSMHVEEEVSESSSSTTSDQMGLEASDTDLEDFKGFNMESSEESGSLRLASGRRTQKQINKRSSLAHQVTSLTSSTRFSFAPRNTNNAAKSAPNGQCSYSSRSSSSSSSSNTSRYGIRNLRCTSISDVLQQGSSSSNASHSKRVEVTKKRSPDAECSSSRGKIMFESSSAGNSGSQGNSFCSASNSLSERPPSQPASRRTRYWPLSRKDVTSVRTRKPEIRSKVPENCKGNKGLMSEPSVLIPHGLQTNSSIGESSTPDSSLQAVLLPPGAQNSSVRLGSRNENVRNRSITHPEDTGSRLFNSLSIDRNGFRRFNIDGIAEVLLALERIEHDEELTYEQLLALETNLFLGGLGIHDHHRDLRLDIDNMSYEELLALGDKMGTVSTALTEDQLSNCLQRSYYIPVPPKLGRMGCGDDDVKCSICQEEYAEGDEVGKLRCDHRYHLVCIHQWLQLKNWCPICKAHAAATS